MEEFTTGESVTHAVTSWRGVVAMSLRGYGDHTILTDYLVCVFDTPNGLVRRNCYSGELLKRERLDAVQDA